MKEPRETPSAKERYMGLEWIHAGFSKDPNTQVGSVIVSNDNIPLGSGYNGPPKAIKDDSFDWERPNKDSTGINKYHLVRHAEINAIDHSHGDLTQATLYVTALPCPSCMLEIVAKKIGHVIYFDYQSSKKSSLQNSSWRDHSFEIAKRGQVKLEKFEGNLSWVLDWSNHLKEINVVNA